MKKKTNNLFRFFLLVFILFLPSCRPLGKYVSLNQMDTSFPDLDIVFQLEFGYSGMTHEIGFINADGSELTYFQLPFEEMKDINNPVWSDDGGLLFYGTPGDLVVALIEKDYPLSVKLRNKWAHHPSIIHGTHEILLNSALDEFTRAILREDYLNAEILETYPMEQNVSQLYIGTNNFVDQQLLYSQFIEESEEVGHSELIILNTNTNQKKTILRYDSKAFLEATYIINPAFSPDGEWIAYTSNDGIYLIHPDGSENHRVVKFKYYFTLRSPAVSWAPDGEAFVYHRCLSNSSSGCSKRENNVIYLYDFKTQELSVLVVGGGNPYWRWRETK